MSFGFSRDGLDNFELLTGIDHGYKSTSLYRNSLAQYWLPDVDEWYKTAYYDPRTETYVNYTTGSNVVPTAVVGGAMAGMAVYDQLFFQGPSDVETAGGRRHFGVMGGNAWEWNETAADLSNNSPAEGRVLRGGTWFSPSSDLHSQNRLNIDPAYFSQTIGFRVAGAASDLAVLPEPSTIIPLGLAAGLILGGGGSVAPSPTASLSEDRARRIENFHPVHLPTS